ncbi:HAD-IA family hydrolase [Roseivivax sp. CAU 1761]
MTDLRLVIFDVDGTLVDSQADIVASVGAAFGQMGRAAPARDAILGIVGLSLPEAMAVLAPDLSPAEVAEAVAGYKASYQTLRARGDVRVTSPLYPGVRQVIETLHAHPETLLGVATGKSRRGLEAVLGAHGIRPRFVTAQCADDHPSKPHPAMIEAALAETGVPAHRAVMVGDTSFDMDMARSAGVTPIGVAWGYHSPERLGPVHRLLDRMDDLPALLDTLWETA